jgi:signal peptidase II
VNKKDILWKLAYLAASGAVFIVDQMTKAWAKNRFCPSAIDCFREPISVISGFLNFAYETNTGVAFSFFDDHGDSGRWGLSAVAIVAAILVLFYFWRVPRSDDRVLGALALLLAGIVGNVTDRMRLGHVIDFIDVQFGNWHYPTFNVADMAICTGAGLLILDIIFSRKKSRSDDKLKKDVSGTI